MQIKIEYSADEVVEIIENYTKTAHPSFAGKVFESEKYYSSGLTVTITDPEPKPEIITHTNMADLSEASDKFNTPEESGFVA